MTVRCACCAAKSCRDCDIDKPKPYRHEPVARKQDYDPRPTPEENFRRLRPQPAQAPKGPTPMALTYKREPSGWSWGVLGWPKRAYSPTLERAITDSAHWIELVLGAVRRAGVAQCDGYFKFTRTESGWVSSLAAAREAATLGRAVVEVFGEPASMSITMEGDTGGLFGPPLRTI